MWEEANFTAHTLKFRNHKRKHKCILLWNTCGILLLTTQNVKNMQMHAKRKLKHQSGTRRKLFT